MNLCYIRLINAMNENTRMLELNKHTKHPNTSLSFNTISWSTIGQTPNSWINLLNHVSQDYPGSLADAARQILKNDFGAEYHVTGSPWTASLVFPDSDARVRFLLTWG